MKNSGFSDMTETVEEDIQKCKNLEEVQLLGIQFRNKSDLKKIDYELGNEKFNLEAASKCFSHVIRKLPSIKDLEGENLLLYLRALHNLGTIDCKFKNYNKAQMKFLLASMLGFKASSKNLEEIKKNDLLIKKDEKILIEDSKSSHIARIAYRTLKEPMLQFLFFERKFH